MSHDPEKLFDEIAKQYEKKDKGFYVLLGKLVIAGLVAILVHNQQYAIAAFVTVFFCYR